MNWPLKPLGNFLSESRIISTNPAVERRIRVRLNAGGVEKRPVVTERKGVTRYFIRRSGQFIYGKQNLHKGAFGVIPNELDRFESSSDLPAFDVSEDMRPKWIEYFFKQGNCYQTLVSIAKGAATKRIQPQALFGIHIPSPPIHIQDELIYQMDACCSEQAKLLKELAHQETLLTQLKQAILHEAVQGKLTADWRQENPDVEPASQLLECIRREKQRLVAEKKIRREKPLPPIAPEEIPFEIPEGWAWCRFAEIGILSPRNNESDSKDASFIPMSLIPSEYGKPCASEVRKWKEISKGYTHFRDGDVGLAKITPCFQNQKSAVFRNLVGGFGAGTTELHIIRPITVCADYILIFFKSPHYIENGIAKMTGTAGQKRVPKEYFSNAPFPLPPLSEQKAIVKRVESLLASCRQLEAEIGHARAQAENLLQAVLKEAFTPKTV